MKKTIKIASIIAVLFVAAFSSKAQTFYGLQLLSGTNYAPILLHFAVQSNQTSVTIQAQTLVLTNVFTNEQAVLAYCPQILGATTTNGTQLANLTTNFTGANGWTVFPTNWTYNITGGTYYFQVSPWGMLGISSNGLPVPYPNGTNGVGLQ